jgi:hypothetical protein
MMNLSKNGVALATLVLAWFGFNVAETDIQEFVASMAQIIAFLLMLWNQIDRKNTKWLLWKTDKED